MLTIASNIQGYVSVERFGKTDLTAPQQRIPQQHQQKPQHGINGVFYFCKDLVLLVPMNRKLFIVINKDKKNATHQRPHRISCWFARAIRQKQLLPSVHCTGLTASVQW